MTERRLPTAKARSRVSAVELRLYVVALLAAVYTISWRAIGGHTPAPPQRAVRIENLPPETPQVITLPAGWQLQSSQPARTVQAPPRRAPRVRTRSS